MAIAYLNRSKHPGSDCEELGSRDRYKVRAAALSIPARPIIPTKVDRQVVQYKESLYWRVAERDGKVSAENDYLLCGVH
jgi:hypothetical protein